MKKLILVSTVLPVIMGFALSSCANLDTVRDIMENGYLQVNWVEKDSVYYHTPDVQTLDPDTVKHAEQVNGILLNAENRKQGYMSFQEGTYVEWTSKTVVTFGL